jgi:hypothetical protein
VSRHRWIGLAAAGAGTAAAAAAAGLAVERRVVRERRTGAEGADALGALRGEVRTVLTDDGVTLHAEVDEVAPYAETVKGRGRRRRQ